MSLKPNHLTGSLSPDCSSSIDNGNWSSDRDWKPGTGAAVNLQCQFLCFFFSCLDLFRFSTAALRLAALTLQFCLQRKGLPLGTVTKTVLPTISKSGKK